MSNLPGLLAAVIADPEDDIPRLLYADAMEEDGQTARAEFVRVQIELAKTPERIACDGMGIPVCDDCGGDTDLDGVCRSKVPNPKLDALRRREQELYGLLHPGIWGPMAGLPVFSPAQGDLVSAFRRGFVEIITLTGDAWLCHATALTAVAPIREVRLTSWPVNHDFGRMDVAESFWPDAFRDMWPGITFVPPPEPSTYTLPVRQYRPVEMEGDDETVTLRLTEHPAVELAERYFVEAVLPPGRGPSLAFAGWCEHITLNIEDAAAPFAVTFRRLETMAGPYTGQRNFAPLGYAMEPMELPGH